ncbi:MAG: MHS family MFS transporter [Actinomycetota bacterium]|nr:MHS family MFS transporter [Actinomycetota bacterium]
MASSSAGAAAPSPGTIRKVLLAAMAASAIEWYDFFIYLTAAALVFPKLFFPADIDPVAGVLASFSTAAVGFVARPVGGIVFAHFGDKLGRKPTLVTVLLLMGVASTLVGLLPTYATIGVWAAVALFILRFCQGLAVGGQWGGAVLLATEYAPPDKRGFYGSFAQIGVPVGLVLGNAFFLVLTAVQTPEAFEAWGWRIPFLASVVLIALAMWIQLRLEDTPAFRRLQETAQESQEDGDEGAQERSPVLEVILEHPKQVLLAGGAFFVVNGAYYILITGILDYGTRDLGLSRGAMLTAVLISSFAQIFLLPAWSALSDRVGRRPVYLVGAVLLGLWGFPMFWLVDTTNIVLITVALFIGQTFLSMMYGPQAALFSEMFSRRVRYSGASIGYQGAAVFAGGLAPIIMVTLLAWTGTSLSVSAYMFAMAVLTFFSVYLVTETYEDEMAEDVATEEAATRG